MATLSEIRQQYPQYGDMSDAALADALHKKFYSDMPRDQFDAKIGFKSAAAQPTEQPYSSPIWPFSKNAKGEISFDSNAGLLGVAKRAFMAPGDAYKGRFDPYGEEGRDRALEFAGAVNLANPAIMAGERAIPGVMRNFVPRTPKVPTAAELKAAADAGYKSVETSGVEYASRAVKGLADDIVTALDKEGRIAELNPELHALLGKLRLPPANSTVSIQSLDALRKRLGDIAGSADPAKAAAASIAIKKVDEFIKAADPSSVMARAAPPTGTTLPSQGAGPAPMVDGADAARAAAESLVNARGNAAARFRSNVLTGLEDTARMRAAVANSGQNLGNTIRQRIASLLADEDTVRGFTDQEVAALRQIVDGTATTNTLRILSSIMGGGGGLGAVVSGGVGGAAAGGVGGNPLVGSMIGMGIPAAGMTIRRAGNAITDRQLLAVDEAVRMRSPLYRQRAANPGVEAVPELSPAQQAVLRLFMTGQAQPQR
jgi:hypothetical protein